MLPSSCDNRLDLHKHLFRLAECVLVYMDPQDSTALVKWLGGYLSTAEFVTYEQVPVKSSAAQVDLLPGQ